MYWSSCLFCQMFMDLSLRFCGNLVFGGILFFVNSTAWSVLHHVHFIWTVQSIQLSVIFVFHVVSMKCMSPLLTCISLLFSLFFRHFYILISASIQLDAYRVTELGQHPCVDKLHIVAMIYNPWTFLFHPFLNTYVLK